MTGALPKITSAVMLSCCCNVQRFVIIDLNQTMTAMTGDLRKTIFFLSPLVFLTKEPSSRKKQARLSPFDKNAWYHGGSRDGLDRQNRASAT
jgi:hypothetical protein